MLIDCDKFADDLNIPTGQGKQRNNMITYLKKIAGTDNITEYIPTTSIDEVVEKTSNNFKYYHINSRGVRKILMTRNEEYREYYLTLEDLWNCLQDQIERNNIMILQ